MEQVSEPTWYGIDGAELAPGEHTRLRLPRAEGADWVMIAPECAAVGCKNGAHSCTGLCGHCEDRFTDISMIKVRWRVAEPTRWESLAAFLGRR